MDENASVLAISRKQTRKCRIFVLSHRTLLPPNTLCELCFSRSVDPGYVVCVFALLVCVFLRSAVFFVPPTFLQRCRAWVLTLMNRRIPDSISSPSLAIHFFAHGPGSLYEAVILEKKLIKEFSYFGYNKLKCHEYELRYQVPLTQNN